MGTGRPLSPHSLAAVLTARLDFDVDREYTRLCHDWGVCSHPGVVEQVLARGRDPRIGHVDIVTGADGAGSPAVAREWAERAGAVLISAREVLEAAEAAGEEALVEARERELPPPDATVCRLMHARLVAVRGLDELTRPVTAEVTAGKKASSGAASARGDKKGDAHDAQAALTERTAERERLAAVSPSQLNMTPVVFEGFPATRAQAQYLLDNRIIPRHVVVMRIASDAEAAARAFPEPEGTVVLPREEEARVRRAVASRRAVDSCLPYFAPATVLEVDALRASAGEEALAFLAKTLRPEALPFVEPPSPETLAEEARAASTPLEQVHVPTLAELAALEAGAGPGGKGKKGGGGAAAGAGKNPGATTPRSPKDGAKRDGPGGKKKGDAEPAPAGPPPALAWRGEALRLGGWQVDDATAGALAVCIAQSTTLTSVRFDGCSLSGRAVGWLARAVRANRRVTSFAILSNPLGLEATEALARELVAPTSESILKGGCHLRLFSLRGCTLQQQGEDDDGGGGGATPPPLQPLLDALERSRGIVSLDLSGVSPLGPAGAQRVAAMLAVNRSLRYLGLAGTACGDEGAAALAASLWRIPLTEDEAADYRARRAAAEAERDRALREAEEVAALAASGKGPKKAAPSKKKGEEEAPPVDPMSLLPTVEIDPITAVIYRPANRTLERLAVDHCGITASGLEELGRMVTRNHTIQSVSVQGSPAPEEILESFQLLFSERADPTLPLVEPEPQAPPPPPKKVYKPFVLNLDPKAMQGKGKGKGKEGSQAQLKKATDATSSARK
jgi:hypothetical protein